MRSKINIRPILQTTVLVTFLGDGPQLEETHPNIFQGQCQIAPTRIIVILLGFPFFIYIAKILAKAGSLP